MKSRGQFIEDFMAKVEQHADGCWVWLGGHTSGGYPRYQCGWANYAHRVMWTITNGPIPDGLDVCHTCDNPGCVRPSHLWAGTAKDNLRDAVRKGRIAKLRGELSGNHTLTWESVREIRRLLGSGVTQRVIAKQYGVTQPCITHISTGKTWVE